MKINACDVLHCIFQIVSGTNYRLELNLNTVSFSLIFHVLSRASSPGPRHEIMPKPAWPRFCKTFVMLDFLEHEIYYAHKC